MGLSPLIHTIIQLPSKQIPLIHSISSFFSVCKSTYTIYLSSFSPKHQHTPYIFILCAYSAQIHSISSISISELPTYTVYAASLNDFRGDTKYISLTHSLFSFQPSNPFASLEKTSATLCIFFPLTVKREAYPLSSI